MRYVLEGSIRRAGDRVRITAQLIDATTGAHRWAERYDRELKDVFAVQDEVARTVATVLAAHVNKAEAERTLLKPPATWQAYDYYALAADTVITFMSSWRVEDLYEAKRPLEQVLSIDPKYARAHVLLSQIQLVIWINPLDHNYLTASVFEQAYQLVRKALQLDPNLPQAHAQASWVLNYKGHHDAAITEYETSIALNPNYSD